MGANLIFTMVRKAYAFQSLVQAGHDLEQTSPQQQQLLDIMIESYKLSQKKLRNKYKLHIICAKSDGFSLNKLDRPCDSIYAFVHRIGYKYFKSK